MKLYAIRKRGGQWAVCSDDNVVLQFETYDEAVTVARSAAEVLRANSRQRTGLPNTELSPPQEPSRPVRFRTVGPAGVWSYPVIEFNERD